MITFVRLDWASIVHAHVGDHDVEGLFFEPFQETRAVVVHLYAVTVLFEGGLETFAHDQLVVHHNDL
jgi:hypothetical protein